MTNQNTKRNPRNPAGMKGETGNLVSGASAPPSLADGKASKVSLCSDNFISRKGKYRFLLLTRKINLSFDRNDMKLSCKDECLRDLIYRCRRDYFSSVAEGNRFKEKRKKDYRIQRIKRSYVENGRKFVYVDKKREKKMKPYQDYVKEILERINKKENSRILNPYVEKYHNEVKFI